MRLATVGTSTITDSFIEAVKMSHQLTLTGVYSRSLDKAKEMANRHGATHVFTDLGEMAGSDTFDIVYIASPNSLHFEQSIQFLKQGKHVICEKPFFSTLREFHEAYRVADEQHVYLFEAIRNIQTPIFKRLKENLHKVGPVRNATIQVQQYSSRYDKLLKGEVTNIFSPQFSGGALMDMGVYPLYLAVGLFGKPMESHYYPTMLETGVDGSGTLVLKYHDYVCQVICSKITHSSNPSEINGEKGILTFNNASSLKTLTYTDLKSNKIEDYHIDQYENDKVYEIQNFTDIINQSDRNRYMELRRLSEIVLGILEESRRQNQIIFPADHKTF
ncbi:Gfo/Idh/MocA family protein [Terrilactibacillus laevilacticus]|uniref:Gfo/Idh/MocA family protein n=1 Tax=Terrilactibacillus laevilacticus TaxID=1380157 RepID=A0ABW5PU34_9BACI|nr:Gfo/Idh/MocA family oxidoreductase [Terrilactibacillus laevilacticus]